METRNRLKVTRRERGEGDDGGKKGKGLDKEYECPTDMDKNVGIAYPCVAYNYKKTNLIEYIIPKSLPRFN